MRAFVAIEVPRESVIREMVSVQEELKKTQADLKIVSRENLHFTVKFLGEISEWQAREADKRLKSLELNRAAVTLEGVGAFPSLGHPNIIWAGVAQGDRGKIVPIAERVIAELRGIGEEDSRPYQPHITLARVGSTAKREALVSFLQINATRKLGDAELTHLKLKSSELTPRGPVYSDVGVYPLR